MWLKRAGQLCYLTMLALKLGNEFKFMPITTEYDRRNPLLEQTPNIIKILSEFKLSLFAKKGSILWTAFLSVPTKPA